MINFRSVGRSVGGAAWNMARRHPYATGALGGLGALEAWMHGSATQRGRLADLQRVSRRHGGTGRSMPRSAAGRNAMAAELYRQQEGRYPDQ